LNGVQDLFDGDKPMPITTPVPRQYQQLSEIAFNDAVDDGLKLYRRPTHCGWHDGEVPASAIHAHRLAVERFGCDSFPIPPTPTQREENIAHISQTRRRSRIFSLFSREAKIGLKYLATERRPPTHRNAYRPSSMSDRPFPPQLSATVGDRQTHPAICFAYAITTALSLVGSSRYLERTAIERIDPKTSAKTTEIVKAPSLGKVGWGAFSTPGQLDADALQLPNRRINANPCRAWSSSIATISGAITASRAIGPRVKAARIILAFDDDEAGNTSADCTRQRTRRITFVSVSRTRKASAIRTSGTQATPDTLREYVEQFLEQANRAAV